MGFYGEVNRLVWTFWIPASDAGKIIRGGFRSLHCSWLNTSEGVVNVEIDWSLRYQDGQLWITGLTLDTVVVNASMSSLGRYLIPIVSSKPALLQVDLSPPLIWLSESHKLQPFGVWSLVLAVLYFGL